jgi:4-hydroxythreonine-4-phosphate dehydrogenase
VRKEDKRPFYVIGDPRLYADHVPVSSIQTPSDALDAFPDALPVFPIELPDFESLVVGKPTPAFAAAIIASIETACTHCLNGDAAGMVTNPISKAVLYESGFSFPGHTEFIASLCADKGTPAPKPVMMLVGGGLRVALATIHVPLLRVLEHLTPKSLSETAMITHSALKQRMGITDPKLAFTGLNPHAGENGTIGSEEQDLINPVAAQLRANGIDISDARPADTVFHEALQGQFDAIIAMTHDQGLIPVKTLDMWGGVNTTLGLPIIRTSPDHGTAYEAAASRSCRDDSLRAALALAAEFAEHKNKTHV